MDTVTDVISKVLGVSKERVKPEANFFDLGGNSANAVAVIVNLRKAGFSKVSIFLHLLAIITALLLYRLNNEKFLPYVGSFLPSP